MAPTIYKLVVLKDALDCTLESRRTDSAWISLGNSMVLGNVSSLCLSNASINIVILRMSMKALNATESDIRTH